MVVGGSALDAGTGGRVSIVFPSPNLQHLSFLFCVMTVTVSMPLFSCNLVVAVVGKHTLKYTTIEIPPENRPCLTDVTQESVTFEYKDPIVALVSMLHFNPLAADWENLCFTYEPSDVYDDFCNGDRVRRIQESIPEGTAELNAVMFSTASSKTKPVSSPWMVVSYWVRFSERQHGNKTRP